QIAGQSFIFSLVSLEIPFAPDISLTGVTISPVTSGAFTVNGKGNWGVINGAGALVTFTGDSDMVVDLLLTLPTSFVLSIPGVDWLSLGAVSLEMASAAPAIRKNPFYYRGSGARNPTVTDRPGA